MQEIFLKMKYFYLLMLLLTLSINNESKADNYFEQASPKYEIRAVWLTTIGGIDWPKSYNEKSQKAELISILDNLKKAGINMVFLQTRVRGTTIYPSAIEPWDGCITGHPGKAPSYDPLRFAIDECHKRGMQLHAWVVTIPIGKWDKLGCTSLRKKHPKMVIKIGEDGYMNPENPETADYLVRCCREIVKNYDIDGIHLDYIRYPETWKGKPNKDAARKNITRIVSNIYKDINIYKPWVMLSCAPIGKHDDLTRYSSYGWNARKRVFQDVQQWMKDGIMDAIFPMMYFRDNHFFPFALDWNEHSYGKFVVPGLGIYFLDPKEGKWVITDVERQMKMIRDNGMGHSFFRSKFLTDNCQGIYDFTKQFNSTPSLIPPMWWKSAKKPDAPLWLVIDNDSLLNWYKVEGDITYNVYASEDFPVDINIASNLIKARMTSTSMIIDKRKTLNYAITVQDRYGQESMPIQLSVPRTKRDTDTSVSSNIAIITNEFKLPVRPSTIDADFIIIENLLGAEVKVVSYKSNMINVSDLPEGIYQWRTLGRKGRNHRMGFFSIDRKHTNR